MKENINPGRKIFPKFILSILTMRRDPFQKIEITIPTSIENTGSVDIW
jgi:hypothetical protein